MIFKKKIAVVIPAYNIGKNIVKFLDLIPNYVDQIYLVDDFCPLKTGNYAQKNIKNRHKLHFLFNKKPWSRRCHEKWLSKMFKFKC